MSSRSTSHNVYDIRHVYSLFFIYRLILIVKAIGTTD